jgi:hypothetical protein
VFTDTSVTSSPDSLFPWCFHKATKPYDCSSSLQCASASGH